MLDLRREWIDVAAEVEAVMVCWSCSLTRYRQALCMQVPACTLYAYIDAERLRQVITRLLDHACECTTAFERLKLTLETIDDHVVVSIGGGSANAANEEYGLSLVRELVELHGGSVEARSSTFIVKLPLRPPELT